MLLHFHSSASLSSSGPWKSPLSSVETLASMDEFQVAASKWGISKRPGGVKLSGSALSDDDKEGGEIEDFFGQLWWVPLSPRPRVSQQSPLNLC
jgi:hypothetical protein